MNSVLDDWINPYYLSDDGVEAIRQSIIAKPTVKYAVLDNFFLTDRLDALIDSHSSLQFSEEKDRRSHTGEWLPYDSSVVFAEKDKHFGHELFFCEEWHKYLSYITGCNLKFPTNTEVKLRLHKPYADGFWIHTDSTIRSLVAICYFNKNWTVSDGALLQLWDVEDTTQRNVTVINNPSGRLDFLNKLKRIRTSSPGGGFPDNLTHDLKLVDQIVPLYNRLFVCNYQDDPAYHSVTPSNGKYRTGFVQWLGSRG